MVILISELMGGILYEWTQKNLRAKMVKIKEGKYFSHPEVVATSQDLDTVLDKYQVMIEVENKKLFPSKYGGSNGD